MKEGSLSRECRNPAIGRFTGVDPLAEKTQNMCPYNYGNNNPVSNIDPTGGFAISVHYMITQSALKKLGYSSRASDLVGHYASTYADNPAGHMGNVGFMMARQQGQLYRKGINYSGINDSQNTPSISTSTWHSMKADNENISNQKAMERGQSYGWGKIFEAGAAAKAAGGFENLGQNSKGIQALDQGIHALQDAIAHRGTDMANHSVPNEMSPSSRDFSAAFSITENAIVLTEVMGGNYNNLGNGLSLNFEGMSSSQLKSAISGLLKGMETNNIGIINLELGKNEQVLTR